MEAEFREIYDNNIPHSTFLSEKAIFSCMYQAYQLGCDEIIDFLLKKKYLNEDAIKIKSEIFNSLKTTKNENP